MPEARPSFYDDLAGTLDHAMTLFARSVADRRSPFHTPCLATVGLDGRPRLRTVVLRGLDRPSAELRFHTDRRSEKAREMTREPRVALHAYDPAAKLQVRIEGTATLYMDGPVADAAWAASRPVSRVCYGVFPASGEPIGEGGAYELPKPDGAADERGRSAFAVVAVTAQSVETLYLAFQGHRRALFRLEAGRLAGADWLVP